MCSDYASGNIYIVFIYARPVATSTTEFSDYNNYYKSGIFFTRVGRYVSNILNK